tara:strand:+ start:250 stop:477 length:228 start_codon:yes stop_codon:yes gene_type:complete
MKKKKNKMKDNPEDRFGKHRQSSAKKSFPDLTGDGKVTKADVLKGRGVFKDGGVANHAQLTGWGKVRPEVKKFGK